MLDLITPLILTYNEEANIERVLDKLAWARQVLIVDSGSTDSTREIAERFPNVRMVVRPFDTHATQWNYALKQTASDTEWVMALDADYIISDELIAEIRSLNIDSRVHGCRTSFQYCLFGKPLSGSLYPAVVTLFRKRNAYYVQEGHTQRLMLNGDILNLKGIIYHDDRKPLSRWLMAQDRYAQLECGLLLRRTWSELCWQDKIRKLIFFAPFLVPVYCLTIRKGFLDGRLGFYYALQRGIAEAVLSLKLLEAEIIKMKR